MLGRAAHCTQILCQSCPEQSWARAVMAARLKARPGAEGGLQEAAAPASGFGSTVNTEIDDLTTGMN